MRLGSCWRLDGERERRSNRDCLRGSGSVWSKRDRFFGADSSDIVITRRLVRQRKNVMDGKEGWNIFSPRTNYSMRRAQGCTSALFERQAVGKGSLHFTTPIGLPGTKQTTDRTAIEVSQYHQTTTVEPDPGVECRLSRRAGKQ